jgi:Effector protein
LGNVLVVVTDLKIAKDTTADATHTPQFYMPDVYSVQNYYAFGQSMPGWSATAAVNDPKRYRFGMNGQERDVELPGGSTFTALFWEYDGRIGRRWNLDSRPNKSFSYYSSFADNPIWFSDPFGDTLKITHRTGFMGLKKETLTIRNCNLYNADGSNYTGKVTGFLRRTSRAIENISRGSEGESLLGELESSTNVFTIVKGNENQFTPLSSNKSSANIPELQSVTGNKRGSLGSGGKIEFNPFSTEGGFNTSGTQERPGFIGLAHELFHARDANQGVLFPANDYTNYDTGAKFIATQEGLKKSEWRAVYYENILRGQLSIHLRTHYGVKLSESGNNSPDGPKLLDKVGNPINYELR